MELETNRRGALVGIATGLMLSTLAKNNEVAAAVPSNLEPTAAQICTSSYRL